MPEFDATIYYKTIPNFPEYKAGTDGSIWSSKRYSGTWVQLKPQARYKKSKHLSVRLNGKYILVHKLILETFICSKPLGMEACHFPDRNPENNSLSNLRWGTKKDNAKDRDIHKTTIRGEKSVGSCTAKLTEVQVINIREQYAQGGISHEKLAIKYNVTPGAIFRIIHRINWKHVN